MALQMLVCPHDTVHHPERWYRLVQYLTPRIAAEIHFELSLDFEDFQSHLSTVDLVYANPADSLKLITQRNFVPLARPGRCYDEAMFLSSVEHPADSIHAMHGATVATVTTMLPAKVALHALKQQAIIPGELVHRDSWQAVVGCIYRGEVPFGIVYRDSFESLSAQGKSMAHVIAATNEQAAFHSMLLAPQHAGLRQPLQAALIGMQADPVGQEILAEMGCGPWTLIGELELAEMARLALH